MRIGVVATSYPRTDDDPAGAWVAEHAAWLAARGHRVEVIAAGDAAAPPTRREPPGVEVERVPGRLFFRGGAPEAFDAAPWAALRDGAGWTAHLARAVARRARRWDVAFAHWILPTAAVVRAVAPRLPLVAVAHSGDVHLAARLGLGGALAAALAGRRTRLVCVSEAVRDRWIRATPSPLRGAIARAAIQPMGLDVARFAAARSSAAPGAALEVAFVGRLVPIKGADVLVAAAAALRGPVRVRIAGAGPEAARLDAAIAAARLPPGVVVERLGERVASARDALLGGADVVAIPSRAIAGRVEGAPRIALEAMAAGAAVVASASGGLAELPADAATLVVPDDPAALAAAIDALARDPARRAAQVAAARARVDGFAWDVVGARLEREARGAIDAR